MCVRVRVCACVYVVVVSFIYLFIYLFIHLFVHSFFILDAAEYIVVVYLFIYSFIYLFYIVDEAEYMHYGKITFGVDERAEVALLSRNILVKGTLEEECYGIDQRDKKLCDYFKEDTFGGHFKVTGNDKYCHLV